MSEESQGPSAAGTFSGYFPEWKNGDKWEDVPVQRGMGIGAVPQPLMTGGITATIGLYGEDQALALAHGFAAWKEAEGPRIETRVIKYKVTYKIDSQKLNAGENQ